MNVWISSFYKFFSFPDYAMHRERFQGVLDADGLKGSLLLASEGVNGTLSGSEDAIERVHLLLEELPGCKPLSRKLSRHETQPFGRAKVRLKKELISLGEESHPEKRVGNYVSPEKWNMFITSPDVILLDARNYYETHLGRFRGAIDPKTRKFTQLPEATRNRLDPSTHKRVATYCTGGIRCEKYTSWLLDQGFEEVYHLEGGILNYLEQIPANESLFEGACYVFDERIAVGHGVETLTAFTACPACGHSLTQADRDSAGYVPAEVCPYCETHLPSNR